MCDRCIYLRILTKLSTHVPRHKIPAEFDTGQPHFNRLYDPKMMVTSNTLKAICHERLTNFKNKPHQLKAGNELQNWLFLISFGNKMAANH